jgi:replication factor A1
VTAWNDQVDAFFGLVQPGGVYLLSRGSLKPKNARFNSTRHEFEIFLERASTLVPVDAAGDADAAAIPHIQYNFLKLAEIDRVAAGAVVDVVGVVTSVSPPARITRRDGTDTDKRSVTLKDDSGVSVEVRCAAVSTFFVGRGATCLLHAITCALLFFPRHSH